TVSKINSLRKLDISETKMLRHMGPIHGLVNLEELYLQKIGCIMYPSTISCQYGAFESIKILNMSHNVMNMSYLKSNTTLEMFSNCNRLQHVDLSYNKMSRMPFLMFQKSRELKTVYLGGNNLEELNIDLESARKLEKLDISDNELQELPQNIRRIVDCLNCNSSTIVHIYMKNNPLICGCHSFDFVSWMQDHNKNIAEWENLECLYTNYSKIKMHRIDLSVLKLSCWKTVILAATIPCGVMLLIGYITIVIYRRRYKINYLYLQLRAALRRHGKDNDDEYDFDAFISYSSLDKTWGLETLYATLVGIHHYSICIDDRNFRPGAYISDIIIDAINRSNKVIL
ncbi:unnamed protein product, partial [Owenia fusiformis]